MSTRCGFVALLGEPNAGKSTLLNRMVGAHLAAVTHKVQTTRMRLRGIRMEGAAQIVFVDTPGLFRPGRRLDRAMVAAAWAGAADADIAVLLVDARRGITAGLRALLEELPGRMAPGRPLVLALNKVDLVPRGRLLPLSAEVNTLAGFAATFMISATTGSGTGDLASWLAARLPEGPWLFPEDQVGDLPLRLHAAELTREALMERLHEELPYHLTVETEGWQEHRDGSVRIDQVIYVARPGHKGIVLGRGGQALKGVGRAARAAIGRFLGREAHLFLTVRVRENWQEEAERYRALGLDFEPRK